MKPILLGCLLICFGFFLMGMAMFIELFGHVNKII